MNNNLSQKLFINRDVKRFVIDVNKTIREAIPMFGLSFGWPRLA